MYNACATLLQSSTVLQQIQEATMKTLVIPDVHVPFHCKKAEKLMHKLIKEKKPEKIVFLGDVCDVHALTSHPKIAHWRDNLEEELYQTYEYLWNVRKSAGDKTEIIYIKGNHEHRWERMVDKCAPFMSVVRNMLPYHLGLEDLDIHYVFDAGKEPIRTATGQGEVRFLHGHEIKGGGPIPARHALKIGQLLGESVHIGHTHKFGMLCFTTPAGDRFAIEGGYVADKNSPGMEYGFPQTNWVKAIALYDDAIKSSPLPEFFFVD